MSKARPASCLHAGGVSLLPLRSSNMTKTTMPPMTTNGQSIIGVNGSHDTDPSAAEVHECIQSHHDHMGASWFRAESQHSRRSDQTTWATRAPAAINNP